MTSFDLPHRRQTCAAPRANAFTLIELMLVVAIIGILAATAVWSMAGTGDRVRIEATKNSMRTLKQMLGAYQLSNAVYPPTLSALASGPTPFIDKIPQDAWKHDLVYTVPGAGGKPYNLYSLGKDHEAGSDDDISVWTMDEEPARTQ